MLGGRALVVLTRRRSSLARQPVEAAAVGVDSGRVSPALAAAVVVDPTTSAVLRAVFVE